MKRMDSMGRKLIPGLLLGFLVLVGLALIGDLRQVGEVFSRFNWWMFPVALGFTLFNYGLRYIKFLYYLRLIGGERIPWYEGLRIFVAGFPLAVTPGKVGEALKGVWINQSSGVSIGKGISAILAERISDGMAVLLLSTLGVFAYPQYWPAFGLILLSMVGLITVIQIRPAALSLLSLGEKIALIKGIMVHLRDLYEGSYTLFKPIPMAIAVGLGIVSWFGEGIGFYFILIGLGLAPGVSLFGLAVFVLSFSTVVGAVSALPGGLGAAEASIAGMLALLGSISPAVSTSATLLIRLATLWFGVLLGLIVWSFSLDFLGLRKQNGRIN
jgi:glycosyltransferase 2 family protein